MTGFFAEVTTKNENNETQDK